MKKPFKNAKGLASLDLSLEMADKKQLVGGKNIRKSMQTGKSFVNRLSDAK